jgi:hypothetical protein
MALQDDDGALRPRIFRSWGKTGRAMVDLIGHISQRLGDLEPLRGRHVIAATAERL